MATVPPDAPVPPLKDTPAPALASQTAAAPAQPIGSDPVAQSAAFPEHPASIEATAQTAPSTAEHPYDAAPTSTIDPNVPSSESAPTALPTNPNTHPKEQQEAIKHEHPEVVGREKEKTKAAEREVKGEKPEGTVVKGIEDDRLYSMLRRFDEVCSVIMYRRRGKERKGGPCCEVQSQRRLETSGMP